MPGEEREEAGQTPCSQAPGPCRARVQQPPQGMVQENRNMQAAGGWEMRLELSRSDED